MSQDILYLPAHVPNIDKFPEHNFWRHRARRQSGLDGYTERRSTGMDRALNIRQTKHQPKNGIPNWYPSFGKVEPVNKELTTEEPDPLGKLQTLRAGLSGLSGSRSNLPSDLESRRGVCCSSR